SGALYDLLINRNESPIYIAVKRNKPNCLLEFLEFSSSIDLSNPLISASSSGHSECGEQLIKGNADLEAHDDDGNTGLILAAQEGHFQCLKMLLESGASVDIANKSRVTAL
ncbi:unnamed protein product, partial [Lymnaea stagnalis]